ncbi:hypothetical protein LY78DRAFT_663679 [Colletotrichum sublineola]|nr:hypothetical protein LY78DRAFT_663679 [Colletotrichum sublineola]
MSLSSGNNPNKKPPSRSAKKPKLQKMWSMKVRFHWLRETNITSLKSVVDFSADPTGMFQEPDIKRPIKAVNRMTWRPIENGQVFTFSAEDRDDLPDYDILLLQWGTLRMWRLAGGADSAMYSDDPYDSDDDKVPAG